MDKLKNIIISNILNNSINIPSYVPEPLFYPFKKVDTYNIIKYRQFHEYQVSILISNINSPKLIYIRITSEYECISIRTNNIQIFNFVKNNFEYDYYKKNKRYYYIYMLDCDIKKFIKKFISLLKKEYILI